MSKKNKNILKVLEVYRLKNKEFEIKIDSLDRENREWKKKLKALEEYARK